MRAIFILLAIVSTLQAQIVADSDTKIPIQEVIVSCGVSVTYTNQYGVFAVEHQGCDTLVFTHLGYVTEKIPAKIISGIDTVFLTPKNLVTEDVVITDSQRDNSILNKTTEKILTEKEKGFYQNLSEVINKNSTLVIKDYGGYSGLKTASVRGLSSENTIVLFNEAKVNDIRTGTFDLSLVSPTTLSGIRYSGYSTDAYYGAAAGGVLKLSTNENNPEEKLLIGAGIGSYAAEKYNISYQGYSENINYGLNAERSYSSNEYEYNFYNQLHARSNSFYSRSFISGNFNYNRVNNSLSFYTHYSSMKNGLPGFVTANNFHSSKAVNINKSLLFVLNDHLLLTDKLFLTLNVSTHLQKITYEDPENKIFSIGTIQSSNLLDISYGIKGNYNLGEKSSLSFGYRGSSSKLTGLASYTSAAAPPEKVTRFENILFAGISSSRDINLGIINYVKGSLLGALTLVDETIYNNNSEYSPAVNLGVEVNFNVPLKPSLVFHYSKDTRIPTFNERYYSGLYDISALESEKYNVFDAGIEINHNITCKGKLSLYYFHVTAKNKIVWTPYLSTLQVPRNLNEAVNSGLELILSQNLQSMNTDLNLIYTYTNAKNVSKFANDNADGKQLIYTPKHNVKAGITWSPGIFSFNLSMVYTGSRFYTYDNDPYSKLDPFFVTDFSTSMLLKFWNTSHRFTINVFNLLDEDYMVIQSYPMPKRTMNFNYIMELL